MHCASHCGNVRRKDLADEEAIGIHGALGDPRRDRSPKTSLLLLPPFPLRFVHGPCSLVRLAGSIGWLSLHVISGVLGSIGVVHAICPRPRMNLVAADRMMGLGGNTKNRFARFHFTL